MSSLPSSISSASVRNILTLLASRDAHLVAGAAGLERRVTWACYMRVRLPAFESLQGGEFALVTLSRLSRLDETLPHLLKSLNKVGVAAVGVAAPTREALGHEAEALADQLHLPLILLPANTVLDEISREIITFVVSFRDDVERKATEISQQLLQLSAQGLGMQGICQHLANSRNKWVVVQDADQRIRFQASPAMADTLLLPLPVTDELLRLQGLTRVVEPILIRHEIVGYLSLVGNENDFDYLERIILGQVSPILALEFARERERSEVESRYQVEALTDVLQGHYQQPEEMQGRARILGYDLTVPQVVVIFEMSPSEPDFSNGSLIAQWSKRVREELLRIWPSCWILSESRRVIGLLPLSELDCNPNEERECENAIFARIERLQARLQQNRSNGPRIPLYSCGIGRFCGTLQGIPQSNREAQQALEVGRRLFGEGKIHSFARLGIYRLLFYLDGQNELNDFYQETLGPLLAHDARNDGTLIETLEGFFRCHGNLSVTARTMHLHRNSLLYRLDRIQEILGHSLEDAELRLSLQIALKIHHLHKR
jgi:PucR family transcriptional regulator, purine catabolism regulatory protein